jgi:phosphatidylserine/phosphatidylglycerophosphate/cardiolipin synthase-like enzyme
MSRLREGIYLGIIIILLAACISLGYSNVWVPQNDAKVFYNRDTGLDDQVMGVIQSADKYVYFGIYTFTKTDIKDALLGAKHRGLDVQGVTDKQQYAAIDAQKKIIDELRAAGIPIAVQTHSAIMHVKLIVTDKGYASGSYNWTASATKENDEVLEVGHTEIVRKQYYQIIRHILREYPPA